MSYMAPLLSRQTKLRFSSLHPPTNPEPPDVWAPARHRHSLGAADTVSLWPGGGGGGCSPIATFMLQVSGQSVMRETTGETRSVQVWSKRAPYGEARAWGTMKRSFQRKDRGREEGLAPLQTSGETNRSQPPRGQGFPMMSRAASPWAGLHAG